MRHFSPPDAGRVLATLDEQLPASNVAALSEQSKQLLSAVRLFHAMGVPPSERAAPQGKNGKLAPDPEQGSAVHHSTIDILQQ